MAIDAYAQQAGYTILEVFKDVVTGTDSVPLKERRGFVEALRRSREEGFPIIVNGLDRISRSTATLEAAIISGKVKVISTKTGEGASSAVVHAEAERAEAEHKRISDTTKAALGRLKDQGILLGNRTNLPEAQQKGAATNKDAARKRAMELDEAIAIAVAAGGKTKGDIAAKLNELGFRTPKRKLWNQDNIRRPLERLRQIKREEKLSDRYKNDPEFGSW